MPATLNQPQWLRRLVSTHTQDMSHRHPKRQPWFCSQTHNTMWRAEIRICDTKANGLPQSEQRAMWWRQYPWVT
jgi:hypothetical protein